MEVGCLNTLNTVDNLLPDEDHSLGWQIMATRPRGPRWQGREAGTCHTDKVSRIKGGVREGGVLITKLMHNSPLLVIESSTR